MSVSASVSASMSVMVVLHFVSFVTHVSPFGRGHCHRVTSAGVQAVRPRWRARRRAGVSMLAWDRTVEISFYSVFQM